MKKLKITFRGKTFYARLLEDKTPHFIAALEAACPFESRMTYAKVCDNEIFFQAPFDYPEEENMVYSVKGHVAFYSLRQCICFWFGDTPSLGNCNQFAELDPASIPAFAEEGQKVWEEPGCRVQVDVVDM